MPLGMNYKKLGYPKLPCVLAVLLCCLGGVEEADAAYEEAFDAVFNLGVESYRHPIPQLSKKTGQQKWSMIEMWPMTVRVLSFWTTRKFKLFVRALGLLAMLCKLTCHCERQGRHWCGCQSALSCANPAMES